MNTDKKLLGALIALILVMPIGAMNHYGSESLTKDEQEAIDADIAFTLMQKELIEAAVAHSAQTRLEADAAYARQLEREQSSNIAPSTPSVRPERVNPSSAVPEASVHGHRAALNERVDTIISSLQRNLSEFDERPPLKNILICGKNTNTNQGIVNDLIVRTGFWARQLAYRLANFSCPTHWNSEEVLKKYFADALNRVVRDTRSIIVVHLKGLMENSPEDRVRTLAYLQEATKQLSSEYMVVITADSLEEAGSEYIRRCLEGKFEVILTDEDAQRASTERSSSRPTSTTRPAVRVTTTTPQITPGATAPSNSASASTSTRSTPSSRASNVPVVNNAAPEECAICVTKQTDMNTPCCLTKICRGCWESSLQATARAGWRNLRQCPFCKAQESSWLNR